MGRIAWTTAPILTVLVLHALVHADQPATAPAVYATPADVFAAAVRAGRAKDFDTYVDCQSPDAQRKLVTFALRLIFARPTTQPIPADAAKEKAAFEAKYGLDRVMRNPDETDKQFADRLAAQIKDNTAFLRDLMAQLASHDKGGRNATPVPELDDLHIADDGTTATGKAVRHDPGGGSTMSMEVKFIKIGGSWKINSMMFF